MLCLKNVEYYIHLTLALVPEIFRVQFFSFFVASHFSEKLKYRPFCYLKYSGIRINRTYLCSACNAAIEIKIN